VKIGIFDFRGLRAIGVPSEVALHRSKTLISGLFKQPLSKLDALESAMQPFSETYGRYTGLVKALSAWRTYVVHNRQVIPHYGES